MIGVINIDREKREIYKDSGGYFYNMKESVDVYVGLFLLSALTALLLTSCAKEEVRNHVKLRVFCKECAIEYYNGEGVLKRDTMYGDVQYTWVRGEAQIDTVPGWTSGYNIVLNDASIPRLSACSFGGDTCVIILKAEGDISMTKSSTVGCAQLP